MNMRFIAGIHCGEISAVQKTAVESDIHTDTLTVCFPEEFIRYYKSGVRHSRYINMHELFSLHSNPASILYFYCIAHRYDCPAKNIPVKDLTKLLT